MKRETCCAQLVLILLLVLYKPVQVYPGEIRPFSLPSTEKSREMQSPGQYQKPPEDPAVYGKFAEDVRQMNEDEKQNLRMKYTELYNEAVRNRNHVEMNYYNDLLNILNQN